MKRSILQGYSFKSRTGGGSQALGLKPRVLVVAGGWELNGGLVVGSLTFLS